ncbi:MAG: phosphatidylglycerol lysyltransferase domain-containing protein [Candidatus Omnitrophota bacterium]|jgi:hypothetical protein
MSFKSINLKDRKIFDKFLKFNSRELSSYAFENIYIWKALFEIKWGIVEGNLCVIFKDNIGAFVYLSLLGEKKSAKAVEKAFKELDSLNKNTQVSRIENIGSPDTDFYKKCGLDCVLKSHDYVCLQNELVSLKGNRFKSQRASRNYFIKHNDFSCKEISQPDLKDCLDLYIYWMAERAKENNDSFYTGMMRDSFKTLKVAIDNYFKLDFQGIAVRIGKELKGFTFGFKLNKETFCILYEITDLSVKGLAQFIFAEFSKTLNRYKYINIMDDSGLDNLKKTKLLYHPVKLIPAYIAKR